MRIFESFKSAKTKAQDYLQEEKNKENGRQLKDLQQAVNSKALKSKGKLKEGLDDLYTLLRLIAAYSSGEYREVAVKSMVAIVGALIYFVNPLDAIPDFIGAFGFLDDITVLAYVIKTFKDEIDRFIEWEMTGKDVEHKETDDRVTETNTPIDKNATLDSEK